MTGLWQYASEARDEIVAQLGQHLLLVGISISLAVLLGVPAGIAVAYRARSRRLTLAVANILQTIPSLALLAFLIPIPLVGGTGTRPAIVALTAYAVLPIVKNTVTGIRGVDPAVREAAVAMGMTRRQLLLRVELPLSAAVILAGVRIATVVTVATATIAAAIGAEGLGVFIFRGLKVMNDHAILAGAIPAALLALLLDAALALLERAVTVAGAGARHDRDRKRRAPDLPAP